MATYWEKRALANTQEETRQNSPAEVVGDSGHDRDETPKNHGSGEVYGGFPDVIEEHVPISLRCRSQQRVWPRSRMKGGVRGNLHGDVSDIEDTQNCSELVPSEA